MSAVSIAPRTIISSGRASRPLVPAAVPKNLSNTSSTGCCSVLTFQTGCLDSERTLKGIRILGGVCFHRGVSGEAKSDRGGGVVLKGRRSLDVDA